MRITVKGITRKYRKHTALEGFNWTIDMRDRLVHGLIGPNGAGKTTIMKILAGIYTYEAGEITLSGVEEDYELWAREHVAFLAAGERGLRFRNTVYDNALYFGALKAIEPKVTDELFNKYSHIMHMDEFRHRKVGSLSTGEKKKAMLLTALASGSQILFLDEPSSGLDISAMVDLQNIIKFIGDESPTSFLISTHDLDFISGIANHYTFMSKGDIAYEHEGQMEIENIKTTFLDINRSVPDYDREEGV